jgi:GT2 family glycosyltransferase
MRYCIVLVVYDPHDLYSRPCALPAALRSVESLRGEFRLEVTVNAASRCPGTVAFLRAWCAEREWAHLRVLRDNEGIAAAFNASVYSVLTDYDAFVFMSGDALLVDNAVLQTFSDAFERWQRVGALHPVSVFEDADDANYSTEWDIASFGRALRSWEGSSVSSLLDDPFSDGVGSLLQVCRSRPLRVTRPHLVLPLTFWAVRASVLLAVGPMDERWRFCYENMDFALRAYLAGALPAPGLHGYRRPADWSGNGWRGTLAQQVGCHAGRSLRQGKIRRCSRGPPRYRATCWGHRPPGLGRRCETWACRA